MLYTLLKYIDRSRFDVTVLVMNDVGVQREAFHALGFRIVNVLDSKLSFLNKVKYKLVYNILPVKLAAKWLLRGIEADSYVAFVEGYCTKIISTISPRKRKIAWVHTDLKNFPWPVEKHIYRNAIQEKDAYSKYDEVICVSQEVAGVMKREYGIGNANTIYNPIDEERIIQDSKEACDIYVDRNKFNIVSVGRLTYPKGYDLLIDRVPEIRAINPNIRLYIIGEGEERPSLERQIQRLGLERHVVLTGFQQNPYSLMAAMNAFVCSSRAEGFSLVIAEAMIIGLPVISMECAGPCELLDNGRYGILCKSYDELAKSIATVAGDEKLFMAMREKSERRAKDFNTEKTIKSIEEIL